MITWIFWRIVETLIVYGLCSIFTSPPNTLGLTVVIESTLLIYYTAKWFLVEDCDV